MKFRHFPSQIKTRSRGRIPRGLAAVLFGLQLLVWGGGSMLEGRAAAESLTRYAHIEDEGTKCPPIHSHLDCVVCRTLTGGAGGVSAPALLVTVQRQAGRPQSSGDAAIDQGCFTPLGSRAPPTA